MKRLFKKEGGGGKMIKKYFLVMVAVGSAMLFIAMGVYAKSTPDIILLKDTAYKKHKKGIVRFKHRRHWDEYPKQYPKLYSSKCGECHHDEKGKTLTEMNEGDDIRRCIECHKIPAEAPKGKKIKKKLTKKEKIKKYHAEALHVKCRSCHKKFNKKHKPKKAPIACAKCHPKKK